MSQLDDVFERLRRELGEAAEVPDVGTAVDAMARAFRQASVGAAAMSGSAVARMLGISRQAVNQRAGRGSLLAVADRDGVRYPVWQFRDGVPVLGLIHLVRAARNAGVEDSALAAWIEADRHRVEAVAVGHAESLIERVGQAGQRRTPVTRRHRSQRAPQLSDPTAR